MQRPEAQVLGMTIDEDLGWGLPPGFSPDKAAVLAAVGLAGMHARATSTLSGGQLQRLAIAAALIRRPALLISDESTAMVDAEGRESLLELLAGLPRKFPVTVLHVTHSRMETARADRVIHLAAGRTASAGPDSPAPASGARPPGAAPLEQSAATAEPSVRPPVLELRDPVLELRDVGHTYAPGTPWAHEALRPLSFTLQEGEGLLITGENGSGKSTLAWILAGLLQPGHGVCTVDGQTVYGQPGSVALAFQHSRLQVQRPTVALDILAAAGRPVDREAAPSVDDEAFVAEALDTVGLPARLAARSIEALSGGQLRRVALAGLIAAQPRVLVLDEPLAGLDRTSRRRLGETLARLRARDGLSLVVISHDLEGLETACPRRLVLNRPDSTAPRAKPQCAGRRPRGPGIGEVLLRQLPGPSTVHRLWAGTKLACLLFFTIVMLSCPGWAAALAGTGLVLAAARAARVPASAVPRFPAWAWALLVLGAGTSFLGHGIGLYLQSMLIGAALVGFGAIVAWTTPVADIAPAIARLAGPLRALGIPVHEWALVLGLCLRSLPLLLEEFRVLLAARRLRRRPAERGRRAAGAVARELVDLLTATTAVSIRRAAELGRAITIRGGIPPARSTGPRPGRADLTCLGVVTAACALIVAATTAGIAPG
jgi:energy-coupling factor transport system ATP-binding protein